MLLHKTSYSYLWCYERSCSLAFWALCRIRELFNRLGQICFLARWQKRP